MDAILVIDGSAMSRELLAKVLEAEGFRVTCAPTLADGLRVLPQSRPSMVLLDPPDPDDGIRFLEALRRNPAWANLPVALLTQISDKTFVRRAGALGVRDYILKQRFSLAELLTRIEKHTRPAGAPGFRKRTNGPVSAEDTALLVPDVAVPSPPPAAAQVPAAALTPAAPRLTRDQTLARIEGCTATRALPGVVSEVMALVNSPRGAITDVAQVLKRDPVLAARVLQVANSAAFASQKPRIATIEEAVRNVGVSGVRSMIMSVGIFESVPIAHQDALPLMRYWQHSFAVASLMDRLLPPDDSAPPGVAHLTGLCHELGEIALRQHFPQELAAAAAIASGGGSWYAALSKTLGIPWSEFVSLMLSKLGLPPVITVPIEEHYESLLRGAPSGIGSVLARALRIANVYAHGLMLAPSDDAAVAPISRPEYRNTFGDVPAPRLDDVTLRSEVLTTVNVLAGSAATRLDDLCKPLVSDRGLRIWYVRHQSYSELDPLAALVGFAGELSIHDRPPEREELASCDAIVVADSRQDNPQAAQDQAQNLARLTAGSAARVMYLCGSDPAKFAAPSTVVCRKLPVSLREAAAFLNAERQQAVAA